MPSVNRVQSFFAARSAQTRAFVTALLLFVVTVAIYQQVRHFGFIEDYDDGAYIVRNFHLQHGLNLKLAKWAFTSYYAGNWDPLTWLSHALDCRIYFLNAGRHHLTNVLIHALSAVVLFWVLWRATGYLGRSFTVAAFFALHPMNVESVAWISERKNVLSMLFGLLALGAYGWHARKPRLGRYVVVFLLYACSLMSKAQIITFPFALLLWDYWPLRRMFPEGREKYAGTRNTPAIVPQNLHWLVMEKLPLLALSAVAAHLTVRANLEGGAMTGVRNFYPLGIRLQNAVVAYVRYIGKFFWPAHLAVIYPYPKVSLGLLRVVSALVLLIAVTWFTFAMRHRARYLLFGWLWFLGTLVPMIGIVHAGGIPMADRFSYFPFIGLFIMICWGVADLYAGPVQAPRRGAAAGRRRSPLWPAVAVGIICAALATVTYRQSNHWKDSLSLWSHVVAVTKDNDDAEDKLGSVLELKGREQEAAAHFRAASAINPADPLINEHVGFIEQRQGELREAISHYQKALDLTQGDTVNTAALRVDALKNMGIAYRELGDLVRAQQCFAAQGELEREYRK
jgi:protein O-mannosyl-transferase